MLILSLLRHAKSSWDDASNGDHDRPLNRRGSRDAPRIGRFLADNGLVPDRVLCSDAVRARATLALVLSEIARPAPKVVFDPRLYLAEPAAIMESVVLNGGEARHCLVVGHNPGLHALALGLTGAGERKALADLSLRFPTAALAVIEIDAAQWKDVRAGSGRLRLFVTPKDL